MKAHRRQQSFADKNWCRVNRRYADLKPNFVPWAFISLSQQSWIVCTQHQREVKGQKMQEIGGTGTLKWSPGVVGSKRSSRPLRPSLICWSMLCEVMCVCVCASRIGTLSHVDSFTWHWVCDIIKEMDTGKALETFLTFCQVNIRSHVIQVYFGLFTIWTIILLQAHMPSSI